MSLSIFDLFKIGLGPSSSHTVGPMWAACRFVEQLQATGMLQETDQVRVHLYGALALTGIGHATDKAVLLGLCGEHPDEIEPEHADSLYQQIRTIHTLKLAGEKEIDFLPDQHIAFEGQTYLPQHPNGMTLCALDDQGIEFHRETWFSVGGGFIVSETEQEAETEGGTIPIPYAFESAAELLALCAQHNLTIAELVQANDKAIHGDDFPLETKLLHIWHVMEQCIERGCRKEGTLPGGLNVERRAAAIYQDLRNHPEQALKDPLTTMDWVSLFALAVNEENASGSRVVTSPTNGAAGVIPAVLAYYKRFVQGADEKGICTFLATAAAIGMLYKKNASISAAEMGCQGEIGVACSMAAAGLAAVMGGTNEQIENAAEIGMEHNLGMTCDPIGGLVQVPCIERNTMGAIKAINAARLALRGDGIHRVSLDSVIETMRQTGEDMRSKYKETALGGLAVNVVLC